MRAKEYNELLESVKQGAEIRKGKRKPSRVFSYPLPDVAKIRKQDGSAQSETEDMTKGSVRNRV